MPHAMEGYVIIFEFIKIDRLKSTNEGLFFIAKS